MEFQFGTNWATTRTTSEMCSACRWRSKA
jgi:hypothetical protein